VTYSQATLVKRIRVELNDNPWFDSVTSSPNTTATTVTVGDGTKYSIGVVIEYQTDGELCLVTGNTLTVIRNYMLSVTATAGTGTAHTSGDIIAADPRYRYMEITEAISTTLSELYPHVYRTIAVSITPVSGKHWYDLASTGILNLSTIYQEVGTSSATSGSIIEYGMDAFYAVRLARNLPTAKVPTGPGLWINNLRDVTNTIYVTGVGQIDDTVSASSYSYITGNDEANCIIFLTAAKLVGSLEIVRVTQDDVSMGDATVQPGMRRNLAQYLEAKGLAERRRWEMKLAQTAPILPISRGRLS
jgi:hypothetical protein